MLLPTKHLHLRESLLGLWAIIISILSEPKTLDKLWEEFTIINNKDNVSINLDDLVLTLDYLYAVGVVEIIHNKIKLCNW